MPPPRSPTSPMPCADCDLITTHIQCCECGSWSCAPCLSFTEENIKNASNRGYPCWQTCGGEAPPPRSRQQQQQQQPQQQQPFDSDLLLRVASSRPPPSPQHLDGDVHDTFIFAARCLRSDEQLTVENMRGKDAHLFEKAGITSESESKIRQDARNKWENLGNEWEKIRQAQLAVGKQEEVKLVAAPSYDRGSVFFRSVKNICKSVEKDVLKKGYKFNNFSQYPGLEEKYHRKMAFILANLVTLIYWHPNSNYYKDAVERATKDGTVKLNPLLLDPVVPCSICGKGVRWCDVSIDAQEYYAPHLPSTVGITHLQCNLAKKSMGFGESAAFMFHYTELARKLALTTDTEQSSKCFKFNFSEFADVYDNVEQHRNNIKVPISDQRRKNGSFAGFGMSLLDLILEEKIPFSVDYEQLNKLVKNRQRNPSSDNDEADDDEEEEESDSEHCSIFSFVSPYGSKTKKCFFEGYADPEKKLHSDLLPIPKSKIATRKAMFEELAGDTSIGDTQTNALFHANRRNCTPGSPYLKFWGKGEDDDEDEDEKVQNQNLAAAAAGGPGRAAGRGAKNNNVKRQRAKPLRNKSSDSDDSEDELEINVRRRPPRVEPKKKPQPKQQRQRAKRVSSDSDSDSSDSDENDDSDDSGQGGEKKKKKKKKPQPKSKKAKKEKISC